VCICVSVYINQRVVDNIYLARDACVMMYVSYLRVCMCVCMYICVSLHTVS